MAAVRVRRDLATGASIALGAAGAGDTLAIVGIALIDGTGGVHDPDRVMAAHQR